MLTFFHTFLESEKIERYVFQKVNSLSANSLKVDILRLFLHSDLRARSTKVRDVIPSFINRTVNQGKLGAIFKGSFGPGKFIELFRFKILSLVLISKDYPVTQ